MRSLREKTESREYFSNFDEQFIKDCFEASNIDDCFLNNDIGFNSVLNLSKFELVVKYITLYFLNKSEDQVFYSNIRGAINIDELFHNKDCSIDIVSRNIESFYRCWEDGNDVEDLIKYSNILSTYEIFNRLSGFIFKSPYTLHGETLLYPNYVELVEEVVVRNLKFIENYLSDNYIYKINEFRVTDNNNEQLKCCTRCYIDLNLEKLFMFLPTQNAPSVLDEVEIFMDYYFLLEKDINLYANIKELMLICPLTNKVYKCELKNLKPIKKDDKTYESIIHKVVEEFMMSKKTDEKHIPTSLIYGDYDSLNLKIQTKIEDFIFKFIFLEKSMCEMFYVLKANHFIGVDPKQYCCFSQIKDFLFYKEQTEDEELKRFRVDFDDLIKINNLRNYLVHNCYVDLDYNISQLNKYNQSVILLKTIDDIMKLLDKNLKRLYKIPGNNLVEIKKNYVEAISSDYYQMIASYNMDCRRDFQINEYYIFALMTTINDSISFENSLAANRNIGLSECVNVLYHTGMINKEEHDIITSTVYSRNYRMHNALFNVLTRGVAFCRLFIIENIDNEKDEEMMDKSQRILLNVFENMSQNNNLDTDTTKESTTLI